MSNQGQLLCVQTASRLADYSLMLQGLIELEGGQRQWEGI